MKAGLLLNPTMPLTGAPAMAARVPVPKPVLNWMESETRACIAVGPLRNSTGKTFKPSNLKKSFLSAKDKGKSERVGASMPIMTFVASAEKLCGKLAIDNKTKLARNSSRKLFLIEVSFASAAAIATTTAWNLLKRPIHVKHRERRSHPL